MKKTVSLILLILFLLLLVGCTMPLRDYLKDKEQLSGIAYTDYIISWWKAKYTERFKQENNLTYQGGQLPEITVLPGKQ